MSQTSDPDDKFKSPSLPVIDFSPWTFAGSPGQRLEVAHELVEACRRTGFVYIANHGVAPSLVEEAFAWSKKMFDLPTDDKMQAQHTQDSAVFRGYNPLGVQRVPMTLRVRGGYPSITGFSPDFNVSTTIFPCPKHAFLCKALTMSQGDLRSWK